MVEEAVYQEFERISERGGVLGAIELMRSSTEEKNEQVANVEAFCRQKRLQRLHRWSHRHGCAGLAGSLIWRR